LAAFGLSAFFFSIFGTVFFPGDTSAFLMSLAVGTFVLTFVGFFFLRVLPHTSAYHAVPGGALSDSQQLRRTSSDEAKAGRAGRGNLFAEPGRSPNPTSAAASSASADEGEVPPPAPQDYPTEEADLEAANAAEEADIDETSSLVSKSSSLPGDVLVQSSVDMDRSHRVDIRGWQLLRNVEFWQFFTIMGILSGIGLMTIK